MTEGDYRVWNKALATRFLQGSGPTPLYLFTDRSVLEEVAPEAGVTAEDAMKHFIRSVTSTLTWREPFRRWAEEADRALSSDDTPTYVAVMCFLVLAGVERERVNFNYYPELNSLLGRDVRAGAPAGFERDVPLMFHRFNAWLEGAGSGHGTPTANPPPHYPYIGWPLSQALIRPADRLYVQRHFASLNLQAGQRLGGRRLTQLLVPRLRLAGESASRSRLLSLHRDSPDTLDTVLLREFHGWSGVARLSGGPASVRLRLCHDETVQEWWFVAPAVEGIEGFPFRVGDDSGRVPSFKGLEAEPAQLWDLVGRGVIGNVDGGPALVSAERRARWLSLEPTIGGWAEVPHRDPSVTQLVLCARSAALDLVRKGCRALDAPDPRFSLVEVPAGIMMTSESESEDRPRSTPSLEGGLRLDAVTNTYLWSRSSLPRVVDAVGVRVDGRDIEVRSGVADLRRVLEAPGTYDVDLDGEAVRLRLVARLRESWTSEVADWVDVLPRAISVVAPGASTDVWVVGRDGELDRRTAWKDQWIADLGLCSNAVDATGAVRLCAFDPAYVITMFMGSPWVTPVPAELTSSDNDEQARTIDSTAAKALVTQLLTTARPSSVTGELRWKKVLAKAVRRVSR